MGHDETRIRTCMHIMPTGRACQSPAMRESAYCYFHIPARRHFRAAVTAFKLPILDSPRAIQLAVCEVSNLLLSNKIDVKKAGRLLYAIQIAASHLEQGCKPGRQPLMPASC